MTNTKRPEGEERPLEPVATDGESFGTWLRRQREGRQITLREIADQSKISLRYLQALEEDRFEVLPASVFAKGFLRQYAGYVGLDPDDAVNFYIAARQTADEEEETLDEPGDATSGDPWQLRNVILGALALLAIVALLFWWSERKQRTQETVPPRAAVERQAPAPAAAPPPVPAVEAATDTVATEAVAQTERPPLLVTLDFVGECWVEARADGARVLSETHVQGESIQIEADREVRLTLGDGGAVQIEVNGRPYAFESTPGSVVRDLRIDLAEVAGSEIVAAR